MCTEILVPIPSLSGFHKRSARFAKNFFTLAVRLSAPDRNNLGEIVFVEHDHEPSMEPIRGFWSFANNFLDKLRNKEAECI